MGKQHESIYRKERREELARIAKHLPAQKERESKGFFVRVRDVNIPDTEIFIKEGQNVKERINLFCERYHKNRLAKFNI